MYKEKYEHIVYVFGGGDNCLCGVGDIQNQKSPFDRRQKRRHRHIRNAFGEFGQRIYRLLHSGQPPNGLCGGHTVTAGGSVPFGDENHI